MISLPLDYFDSFHLVYISTSRGYVKLLWLCVLIVGFSGAGVIIQQSFSSWADSPVTTTIETLPISELDFPNVTVCPPRNTFTSLTPDLMMARNMTMDRDRRRELSKFAHETFFEHNLEAKFLEFTNYRRNKGEGAYFDLYTGLTKMTFSVEDDDLYTGRLNGSFYTPYFRQPFDENTYSRGVSSEGKGSSLHL